MGAESLIALAAMAASVAASSMNKPKTPQAPEVPDESAAEKARAEQLAARMRSKQSTILTSGAGSASTGTAASTATVGGKSLLGE